MDLRNELGESSTVPVNAGQVLVHQRGTGAPLVFVHGLFANAAVWRMVVPILAEDYRCITADWPFGSHRLPMRPDADLSATGLAAIVAEVLDALDLHDVTLVGNDGGGMLTQLAVTRHPERIGRIVLTPCDAYENYPPRMFAYLCWLARVPVTFELLSAAMRMPFLRRLLGRSPIGYGGLSHSRIDDELLDHYFTPVLDRGTRNDVVRFLRTVHPSYTLDAAQLFAEVDRPVLVAWASDDKFFPLEHGRRLARDFPDSRFALVERSRTWVAEDRPAELAALIAEFVRETSSCTR